MTSQDSTPDQPLPAFHPDRIPPHNLIYWTVADSPTEWKNSVPPYRLRTPESASGTAEPVGWPEHEPDMGRTGHPKYWCERCRLELERIATAPPPSVGATK